MRALIFAAGVGSRLKPFTDFHPKALAEIGGKPLLQHVIERLRNDGGITEMVVNVHHFPHQIRDFIKANNSFGIDIKLSDESELLLDTGGGLLRAWELLNPSVNEPIILHNADIFTDFSISGFVQAYENDNADVAMLVASRKSSRMLYFDTENKLRGWKNIPSGETRPTEFSPDTDSGLTPLAFGGVHIVNPSIFPILNNYAKKHGEVFSIVPFYLDNLNRLNIYGYKPAESFKWYDIGSPEKLAKARADLQT